MRLPLTTTYLLTLLALSAPQLTLAQIFLQEGFESGTFPTGWTNERVFALPNGGVDWRFRNGGFNPMDPNNLIAPGATDIARNPSSAQSGTFNAYFQKQGKTNERTRLATPPINLGLAIKPELSFWLCMASWVKGEQKDFDMLRIYYKTSAAGEWQLLQSIVDPVEYWTQVRINLPNPTSTYYIAFEGQISWGFGVCIDNVVVEEKGVIPREVTELTVAHPTLANVPSGMSNIPILRVGIEVYGNTGSAILNRFAVRSLNTDNADLSPNGVRLYRTSGMVFSPAQPIGTPTSFVNGLAEFNSLGTDLPSGQTFIWVTYDVKPDATHGNSLDAMIEVNAIGVNQAQFPSEAGSPPGRRIVNRTVYFENFEGAHGWSLTSGFEVATPQGLGGSILGNPNVTSAFSGTRILGTILSGTGNHADNLTHATAYRATSPAHNLLFYRDIRLHFQRHLNIEFKDSVAIEASRDNGTTWGLVWRNPGSFWDNSWLAQNYSIPSAFDRSSNFRVRYRLGPTDASFNNSGWNIDDVVITGEFIARDASITEWVAPTTSCGLTSAEPVTVRVANRGGEAITTSFPVDYSLNGGATWVSATITEPIPVGGSILFTFPTTANLSAPGHRPSVRARTRLPNDQAAGNNMITTSFHALPTYTPPYTEAFNTNDGFWRGLGTTLWQHGSPAGTTINSSASGASSWATLLSQNYSAAFTGAVAVIFTDDFETNMGWTFANEFDRSDMGWPYYPFEGNFFIGTDPQGAGLKPNAYENGITPATANSAVSPAINVSGHANIVVEFARNLAITANDIAVFQFSPDNGASWNTLWSNNGAETFDQGYVPVSYHIDNAHSSSTQMRFRFAITQSSAGGQTELGWSIDNFVVRGNVVTPGPAFLESPCFNLSGAVMPMIEAKLWAHTEPGVDGVTLEYTIDGGNTWKHVNTSTAYNSYWNWYNGQHVTALGVNGWSGSSGGWITVKQLLPHDVIGVSNVRFRFRFQCDNTNNHFNGIAIDDVRIYETPLDLGVTSIVSPVTSCGLSPEQAVTVRINNLGIRSMNIGERVKVGINIEYSGSYTGSSYTLTEERVLTEAFGIGSFMNYTFTNRFNLSQPGHYTISAYTLMEDNQLFFSPTHNDTARVTILVQRPYIELGPNIYTVRPDTIELDATHSGGGVTYQWFNNRELTSVISTDPVFDVPSINGGQFWVRLTNSIPCSTVDSITVQRLIADVGVSSFQSPVSSCELSDKTPFSVWVTNFGTDTITPGSIVTLGYQIGVNPIEEDIEWELDRVILPGDSGLFVFKDVQMDMSAQTNYSLRAWATIYYDNNAANNELAKTVTVWGYPTISLGANIIHHGTSYTLDPGPSWEAYYWHNDGSTGQTFTVSETSNVTLTVYDDNMCPATDEIHVELRFTSVGPSRVVTPLNACEYPTPVAPSFWLKNLGYQTIPAGNNVSYAFKLNGVTVEQDILFLSADLAPNDSVRITFNEKVDLSTAGVYTLTFIAYLDPGDTNANDNELAHVVNVFGFPTLNLGNDVFTRALAYDLDANTPASNYLWSTSANTRTISVTSNGTYSVTATNGGVCSATDAVNVTFLRHNYGVTQLISPTTGCSQHLPQTVTVRYNNLGNDTLKAGMNVLFRYIHNGGTPVEQNHILSANLLPGNHIDFSFTQKVDLQNPGNYDIEAIGIFAGDFVPSNDGISRQITVLPIPEVYLGLDTIVRTGSITLDAGTGLNYLWNTGSTNQTITVTQTGQYSVVVTKDGCQARDTINVTSLTPDYGVSAIINPQTACALSTSERVTIRFRNLGTDTLYQDESIELRLFRNGVIQATETYTFLEDFLPGQELEHTFAQRLNLSAIGTHTLRAQTIHPLDLNPINDGHTQVINVWGRPALSHLPISPNTVCLNGTPITLSGGTPSGGVYSGTGVVNGVFHPSIAGAGIHSISYTFTSTSTEPHCRSTLNLSINVLALPSVSLTDFSPICEGGTSITLTGGSPTGGVFSGTGVESGIFNPLIAGVGSHDISYTVTNQQTGCSNTASKNLVVNTRPAVTLDLSVNHVCINSPSFPLEGASPSGGTFTGPGVSSNYFNPTGAGTGTHTITYTYTDPSTGCTQWVTDTLRVNPMPTVTIIPSGPVCRDAVPFTLTAALPAGGTYTGTGVSFNTFNPAVATLGSNTIFYSFTDSWGCSASNQMNLVVNPVPVVNIGTNRTICQGDSVILNAGNEGASYLWSTGETTQRVVAKTSGTYSATVTLSSGCQSTHSMVLTVNPTPAVNLGANRTLCMGSTIVLDAQNEGSDYIWITGHNGQYLSVSESGNYWVAVTNAHSCTGYDSVVLTLSSSLDVNLGADRIICQGESITLNSGYPEGDKLWSTSETTQTITVSAPGVYSVVVTGGLGCTGSDEVLVSLNPKPVVTLGGNRTVNTSLVTLDAGEGFQFYLWSDGSTQRTLNVSTNGLYSVTVTDSKGCSGSDAAHITFVKPNYGVTAITKPGTACALGSAEVIEVEITNFGTDTLRIGDALPIALTLNGASLANETIIMPLRLNPGQKFTHTLATRVNLSTPRNYQLGALALHPLDTDGLNNGTTKQVVSFGLPNLAIFNPISTCTDGPAIVLVGGTPLGGVYTGTGVSSGNFSPAAAGLGTHPITYTYTDGNGCSNTITSAISVNAKPTVTFAPINPICSGTSAFKLTQASPSGGVYSGPGVSDDTFNPAVAGIGTHTLTYTLSDANGCVGVAQANVEVLASPALSLGADRTISTPELLDAGLGWASYLWHNGSTNQTLTASSSGLYRVTTTHANGCYATAQVNLTYLKPAELSVSQVLSPTAGCPAPNYVVRLEVTNIGMVTIPAGASITLFYRVGNHTAVQEQLLLSSALPSQQKLTHTFAQRVALPVGTHAMTFWANLGAQQGMETEHSVTIRPNPTVSLGSDTLRVAFPYVLKSGVANVTHLWSTGSTQPEITINNQGSYWVRVTNSTGCSAADTVYIGRATSAYEINALDATIAVYPNPTKGTLNASITPGASNDFTIELFSPLGQQVFSNTQVQSQPFAVSIDVSNLIPGIYILRVSAGGGWALVKVMVER